MTLRLPGVQDLGDAPVAAMTRPVGTYDAFAVARAGAALAEGGRQLGAGIAKAGEGLADVGQAEDRFDYAKAHSDFLTRKIDLDEAMRTDSNYGPDADGKTLPQRYQDSVSKLQQQSSALIQSAPMRDRFVTDTNPLVEQGFVTAQQHATTQANDASLAYVKSQGDAIMDRAIRAPDDATRRQLIDSHSQLVDSLLDKNVISEVQAVQMRQDWAHQYAAADVLHRADTDPQGVINELRAAPGSSDAVTNRIISIEGQGPNGKSSANGTGQFIDSTWLDVLKRNRPDLAAGRSDQDLLLLRNDKQLAREMVGKYQAENAGALKSAGLPATPGNLYLSHFLGVGGATAVLQADPNQPVADALAKAVGPDKAKAMVDANPTILQGRLAGSVKAWADGKMGGAAPGGGSIYDMLRPDTREQLLAHAQTQLQKQNVQDLTGFKAQIEDSQAEAMRTGNVTQPLQLSDFIGHLGAAAGPKAYQGYRANVQLGHDLQSVASLPPDQQSALLESYSPKPGEGFADMASRQDALKKAINDASRLRANDPAFKSRIEESVAEAGRTGTASNPLTPDEFEYHFGPVDGPKAYAYYSASLRLGGDVQNVGRLSPDEQSAMLKGYQPKPGPDFTAQSERQDVLAKAIARSNKERADDPGGFAVSRLPGTQDAYKSYSTVIGDPTKTDVEKGVAARSFASTTLMEQQGAGIPLASRQILPAADVEHFKTMMSTAATSDDPKARVGLIAQIRSQKAMWGDYWPQVVQQLAPSMQPMVRAIAADADPTAMTRLLSLDPKENPATVLKEQSETKSSDVRKQLNTEMAPLLATMVGRQKDRDFFDYYNLADKLSALYVRDGKDASTAAHDAFTALIGKNYDFRDTYRIPKDPNIAPDDVQAGALAAKTQLEALGAKPAIDDVGGLSDARGASFDAFRRDGVWVTSPDNGGLNLMYGDKSVKDSRGAPLFVSWAKLAQLGGTPEARGAAMKAATEYSVQTP
jgi:hypothetical protein